MKATKYLVIIVLLLLVACKSTDPAAALAEAENTRELVDQGDFEIVMQWARPLASSEMAQLARNNLLPIDSRAGQINLVGTQNFIRKYGDSLSIYLPYFGTRQMTANITDTNSAIEFDGIPEDYRVQYNDKKQRSMINFSMKDESEKYNVAITVYSNKRVQVNVNSTYRNSIFYTGNLTEEAELQ